MAATPGWQMKLYREGTLVAGLRAKTMTIGNTGIDITSDDDEGFRTFMALSGVKQIDISAEGVVKDDDWIQEAIDAADLINPYTMVLESGAVIAGDFRINSVAISGPTNDAVTFTAEIQSSGAYTFTPAA